MAQSNYIEMKYLLYQNKQITFENPNLADLDLYWIVLEFVLINGCIKSILI